MLFSGSTAFVISSKTDHNTTSTMQLPRVIKFVIYWFVNSHCRVQRCEMATAKNRTNFCYKTDLVQMHRSGTFYTAKLTQQFYSKLTFYSMQYNLTINTSSK